MSDRSQGPEPGTPEYEWLYGKGRPPADDATEVIPSQGSGQGPGNNSGNNSGDDVEHTRVMPTAQPHQPPPPSGQQQDGQQASGRPIAPPPQQPPPGKFGDDGSGGGRRRPRIRPLKWIKWIVLLWIIFLVATPIFALQKVSTVEAFPDGDRPGEQDGTTYLVVGSDSRGDLSEEERKQYGTGDAGGQRTDTIMLLHIGAGPNLLMSIPRDTVVDIPGHGSSKVNAAYAYGGPKLLVKTIEGTTDIRIDHYVEIGFGGFVDLVDAVGGIEICPTKDMKDKDANLDIKKGCREVDGTVALGYARSRKTDPALGDLTRAKHQREVVSGIGDKIVSPWTILNPLRYWKVNMAGAQTVTTSEGTGPIALARFAFAMTRVNGENGLTCGTPVYFDGGGVQLDEERAEQMFKHIREDDNEGIGDDLCTESGMKD